MLHIKLIARGGWKNRIPERTSDCDATGDATGKSAGINRIFLPQTLCFRAVSPTFAVLSQTAGSGVLTA